MPVLDGVRIGPLDPDKGEKFGQVAGGATARQLIRHHVAMHPPALIAALSRTRQDDRTDAVDREEAERFIRASYEKAGEALPEESRLSGLTVRGSDEQPELQVLTFTFSTKGGRSGKGFVPYGADELKRSRKAGDEAVRIAKAKEAGLPWEPQRAPEPEASGGDSEAAELREQNDELRDENDELREAIEELRSRLAEVEAQAGGSGENGGGENGGEDTTGEGAGEPELPGEPWEGYDGVRAQDVRAKLRESGDAAVARKVLAYETREGGQNRSSVVSAANELIDRDPTAGA